MDRIGNILVPALAKKGLAGQAISAQICFYATKWGNGRFEPVSFSRGTLKVSVKSCSAASELQMQEDNLIEFVNEKMKRDIVKRIRIMNFK